MSKQKPLKKRYSMCQRKGWLRQNVGGWKSFLGSTCETPFTIAYGMKVITPSKLVLRSYLLISYMT